MIAVLTTTYVDLSRPRDGTGMGDVRIEVQCGHSVTVVVRISSSGRQAGRGGMHNTSALHNCESAEGREAAVRHRHCMGSCWHLYTGQLTLLCVTLACLCMPQVVEIQSQCSQLRTRSSAVCTETLVGCKDQRSCCRILTHLDTHLDHVSVDPDRASSPIVVAIEQLYSTPVASRSQLQPSTLCSRVFVLNTAWISTISSSFKARDARTTS